MPNLLLQDVNIDWKELREHKVELLNIIENTDLDCHHEAIIGVTNLIDYLQDQAVKSGIWDESEVFGEEQEDQYFEWEEKYKPIKNHIDTNASYSGAMFETFGEEVEYIRAYHDQKAQLCAALCCACGKVAYRCCYALVAVLLAETSNEARCF